MSVKPLPFEITPRMLTDVSVSSESVGTLSAGKLSGGCVSAPPEACKTKKPLKKGEPDAIIRRQLIVDFPADNPYIKNADVCKNSGVASASANRILTDLRHGGTPENHHKLF